MLNPLARLAVEEDDGIGGGGDRGAGRAGVDNRLWLTIWVSLT